MSPGDCFNRAVLAAQQKGGHGFPGEPELVVQHGVRWLLIAAVLSIMALLYRARTFAAMGQMDAALQDYEAYFGLAVAPNPGDYLAAARLVQHEDPVRALRMLDAGLARLGEVVALQKLAVTIERRRGRPESALARWEELGDALHHGPAWQVELARLLLLNGRDADALQALRLAEEQLAALRSTPARDKLREQIFSLRDPAGA